MLDFLNYFFFAFHTIWTLFNIFGWMWKETRRLHLITMSLTAFSWFILGIFYGLGYCACTDWHWKVRESLGYNDRSDSYIHFLIFKISGINLDPELVDMVTMAVFMICFVLTVFLNIRDRRVKIITTRRNRF